MQSEHSELWTSEIMKLKYAKKGWKSFKNSFKSEKKWIVLPFSHWKTNPQRSSRKNLMRKLGVWVLSSLIILHTMEGPFKIRNLCEKIFLFSHSESEFVWGRWLKNSEFWILSYLWDCWTKVPSVLFYGEIRWRKLNNIVILPYFPYKTLRPGWDSRFCSRIFILRKIWQHFSSLKPNT
jgi:hypothetical protein